MKILFRKAKVEPSLTKELQRQLDQYEMLTPTVCGIGVVLCFKREWPIAQSGDAIGGLLHEFLPTLVTAFILWGLFYNYRKLSKKIVATYEKIYHETLTLKGCPSWAIKLTIAIMLLLFLNKKAYFPVLIVTLLAAGRTFVVVLELCMFPIAMMIDQFSGSSGRARGENGATQVEVIEPEWYVRQRKARENPTTSGSPQKHCYAPSGKIDVNASMWANEITVVIEMKEDPRE